MPVPLAGSPSSDNSDSSQAATPSASLLAVTSSASAKISSWALATATLRQPAHSNIGTSFGMSPNTSTSLGSMPNSAATTARPAPLSTPAAVISTYPRPAWVTAASSVGTTRRATASNSSAV